MTERKEPEWVSEIRDSGLHHAVTRNVDWERLWHYDEIVRRAFVVLETRIRQTAGLGDHEFGKELVDKAFIYPNGVLQPISASGAECSGLYHLMLGTFLYYRNPVAHREISYDENSARTIVSLVDHALSLVQAAAEAVVDIHEFVGDHEGQILRRHDFRLDIDNDGEVEILILLEMGPSFKDGRFSQQLSTVIIKSIAGIYRRIPAESYEGTTTFGPIAVVAKHLTNTATPDIVVTWHHALIAKKIYVLRKHEEKYVLAKRDAAEANIEHYKVEGGEGFYWHYEQEVNIVDVDGDGLYELVQTIDFAPEEIEALGYPILEYLSDKSYDIRKYEHSDKSKICRVLKWDDGRNLFVILSENTIIQSISDEGSLSVIKSFRS